MKELNLKPIYPRKKTTIANKEHKKYSYLLRNIDIDKPNKVWAADYSDKKVIPTFVY